MKGREARILREGRSRNSGVFWMLESDVKLLLMRDGDVRIVFEIETEARGAAAVTCSALGRQAGFPK
jgi:hypothetical protein